MHWMNRIELPSQEPKTLAWLGEVATLARGDVESFDAWIKPLGWTLEGAVGSLGLACAARLSMDPAGRGLGLAMRTAPKHPVARLQALLIAGPLRGGALGGVFEASPWEFDKDPSSLAAEDVAKDPPFDDKAWARAVLRCADAVEWNSSRAELLARAVDICAKAQQFPSTVPCDHNPCRPEGDAIAWLLAARPSVAEAYFARGKARKASFPALSLRGLTWLALAAKNVGVDVESVRFAEPPQAHARRQRVKPQDLATLDEKPIPSWNQRSEKMRVQWAWACAALLPRRAALRSTALASSSLVCKNQMFQIGGAPLWSCVQGGVGHLGAKELSAMVKFLGWAMAPMQSAQQDFAQAWASASAEAIAKSKDLAKAAKAFAAEIQVHFDPLEASFEPWDWARGLALASHACAARGVFLADALAFLAEAGPVCEQALSQAQRLEISKAALGAPQGRASRL